MNLFTRLIIPLSGFSLLGYLLTRKGFDMRYFEEKEFKGFYDKMAQGLVVKLDPFREALQAMADPNCTVILEVSPVKGAVGRNKGPDDSSQHNIDVWGETRAIDLMPVMKNNITGERRGLRRDEMPELFEIAKNMNFTGIGLYPQWKPYPGIHVDVRPDRRPGSPSIWSAIYTVNEHGVKKQKYLALDYAYNPAAWNPGQVA